MNSKVTERYLQWLEWMSYAQPSTKPAKGFNGDQRNFVIMCLDLIKKEYDGVRYKQLFHSVLKFIAIHEQESIKPSTNQEEQWIDHTPDVVADDEWPAAEDAIKFDWHANPNKRKRKQL